MVGGRLGRYLRRFMVVGATVVLSGMQLLMPASAAAAPAGFVASASPEQVWLVDATRYGTHRNLQHIQCLNSLAEDWAKYMADRDMLEHNPYIALGIEQRCGGSLGAYGENIASGYGSNSLFDTLMKSEGHRRNILSDSFSRMGAAAYRDDKGIMKVVQVFADCSDCSGGWNEAPRPQGDPVSVQGDIDIADCAAVQGWSLDMANPTWENRVDMYIDGVGQRSQVTTGERRDISQAYAVWSGRHGFYYALPQEFRDGRQHQVDVYGITTNNSNNRLLGSRTVGPCR